ncbi:MAG TPA: DUF420 domain-containing protein [Verrucomicrobiae bacterium]|nr:DUF420 domain-containing protein [Verrucomicrobiae bacterium]
MNLLAQFPGSAAPPAANVVLVVEIIMGIALIGGAVLARRRRFKAHAWCQAAMVLLNLVVIASFMGPSFHRGVAPGIPSRLGRSYYLLAVCHGILGVIAEVFGLYILLVAGTTFLPKRLEFNRYKAWMRLALVLWWLDLILGLATYFRWYVLPLYPVK